MSARGRFRVALVLVVLLAGLGAVGARLFWVQVAGQSQVLSASYVDAETLDLLDGLLAKGVLRAGPEGRVLVDEQALAREVPRPETRARVRRSAAAARLKPGQTGFDHRLVRVLAPGLRPGRPDVLRGALLDRIGRPLAVSRLNARRTAQERVYPLGAAASQPLGFHHPIYGAHGLEAALDGLLSSPAAPARGREPAAGWDVQLTLDAGLQQRTQELLAGRPGAAVVLDTATGAILAAAGSPSFDTNSQDPDQWQRARGDDKGRLLLCRAWDRLHPPGSTFKLVVAAAWLEAHPGQAPPVIYCHGHDRGINIGDIKPHGRTGLERALVKSCNIYFARLGLGLGDKVAAMAERLGFNRTLDLIPQQARPALIAQPSLAYASWQYAPDKGQGVGRRLRRFTTYRRDYRVAAQCAIGQNLVSATVLQMASVAQAVANGGLLMRPYLVAGWTRPTPRAAWHSLGPAPGQAVMSPATARRLAVLMAQVMTRGTGRSAPTVLISGQAAGLAGKTGTADTGREGEKPHAWFVGFAPAVNPKVAVAVLLENAGLGGRVAAPLGARILAAALGGEIETQSAKAAMIPVASQGWDKTDNAPPARETAQAVSRRFLLEGVEGGTFSFPKERAPAIARILHGASLPHAKTRLGKSVVLPSLANHRPQKAGDSAGHPWPARGHEAGEPFGHDSTQYSRGGFVVLPCNGLVPGSSSS